MDLKVSEMLAMSKELYEKNKAKWNPQTPEFGHKSMLWMIEEIGEVIQIIKKKGENHIMNDPEVREKFTEEMTDILMYYSDICSCFNISEEELSEAYRKKFSKNIGRNYTEEYKNFIK